MKFCIYCDMKTVLITGGSGLIGNTLSDLLISKGYKVSHLGRTKKHLNGIESYQWNLKNGTIESGALEKADYIVHLAGAPIADKNWTDKRKKEIIESRSDSAKLILNFLKNLPKKPQAFISASAVGYYGAVTSSTIFTETDLPGNDFLADVCVKWEKASEGFSELNVRRAVIRTGIVLSEKGGALEKISFPIRFHIDPTTGKGDQFMPWIHISDLCGIYLKAIEDEEMNGTFNAVAPEHINQKQLIQAIKKRMRKILIVPPMPVTLLKLFFGERINILSKGSRISGDKIIARGYDFKFPKLKEALEDIITPS
jgi:uncharacterized protein